MSTLPPGFVVMPQNLGPGGQLVPQLQSAVVYDGLPIASGGAHSINRLSGEEALKSWRHFLSSCAHEVRVDAGFEVDNGAGPKASSAVKRALQEAFAADQEHEYFQVHPVPSDGLDDALALFESIKPQPADAWGNVQVLLRINAEFTLKKADGQGLWPGQDEAQFGSFQTPAGVRLGTSSCRLILTGDQAMGLQLCMPLATDEDVESTRPWLQAHLPFRLSNKQWIRWTLNKNGRTYRPRRILTPRDPA